jgi:hypothetical protein
VKVNLTLPRRYHLLVPHLLIDNNRGTVLTDQAAKVHSLQGRKRMKHKEVWLAAFL